jgi:rRNA-processing protein FCF1
MTPRRPIRVLLDTNFLMIPPRFGVDIRRELERVLEVAFSLATTPAVLGELNRLKANVKTREIRNIEFALASAEGMEKLDDTLREGEDVDDQLVRLSEGDDVIVATTDAEVRKRIKRLGHPIVFMRKKRYLELDGII